MSGRVVVVPASPTRQGMAVVAVDCRSAFVELSQSRHFHSDGAVRAGGASGAGSSRMEQRARPGTRAKRRGAPAALTGSCRRWSLRPTRCRRSSPTTSALCHLAHPKAVPPCAAVVRAACRWHRCAPSAAHRPEPRLASAVGAGGAAPSARQRCATNPPAHAARAAATSAGWAPRVWMAGVGDAGGQPGRGGGGELRT